jgi:hypothetical protein
MEQPRTFNQACVWIADDLSEMLVKKQRDYGKANILEFGEMGVLIRSNDKFARLKNLILNKKDAQNEPITDSWKDVAGYAIIALMLERGWFDLPLEQED